MYKRAAIALRVVAALQLFFVARMLVLGALRDGLVSALRAGEGDQQAILEKLKLYTQISVWTHVGTLLLIVAATVVLGLALRKGRAWAFAAGGLVLAHVAVAIVSQSITISREVPIWLKVLWWTDDVSLGLGLALPLVAVARDAPSPLARYGVIGAGLLLVIELGIATFTMLIDRPPSLMPWLARSSALLCAAWFASVGFPLAGRLARAETVEAAAAATGGIDGTPLRALGWALLARVALGIPLQVLLMLAMANGDYESAGNLIATGTVMTALISIVIVVAMVGYLGFPRSYRSDALILAIGLVLLGIGLEVYAAYAGNQLFGMVAEAKRASSFWGMPSLSKMETLQASLTWAGRGALVLGIGAGLAVLASLKVTARALGASELEKRADRTKTLLVTAGMGVVAMAVVVEAIKRDAALVMLLFGVALLCLAIVLIVNWLKVLFGLATELERAPQAANEQEPVTTE